MRRHAGAAQHDGRRAVRVPQLPADFDQAGEGRLGVFAQRGHAEAQGPVAGKGLAEPQILDVAPVARYGALQDRNDAEAPVLVRGLPAGTLGDAEHGSLRCPAQLGQTRVGEAGVDEGESFARHPVDQLDQGRDDRADVRVRLDAGRPVGQGDAADRRALRPAQFLQRAVHCRGYRPAAVRVDDDDRALRGRRGHRPPSGG